MHGCVLSLTTICCERRRGFRRGHWGHVPPSAESKYHSDRRVIDAVSQLETCEPCISGVPVLSSVRVPYTYLLDAVMSKRTEQCPSIKTYFLSTAKASEGPCRHG